MNILYITQSDPRTKGFGSEQRTHLLWKALGQLGTVYTVVLVGPFVRREDVPGERIHFMSQKSPNCFIWRIQQVLAVCLPVMAWPFRSRQLIRERVGWPEIAFDCAVARYVRAAAESAAWKLAPCYVDIDDLPTESYRTVSGRNHGWFRRGLSLWLIRGWMRYVLRRCAGAWVPNPTQIESVSPWTPCAFLPNLALAPSPDYRLSEHQQPLLMTVGLMAYEPNYEGVDWFLKEVWPAVRRRFPELSYAIAGKGAPEAYKTRWETLPGVQVLGFVENLEALYAASMAVVTPIRSGAGTCIKVLEACAYGRRNFATAKALRGLMPQEAKSMGASVFADSETFLNDLTAWLELPEHVRAAEQIRIAREGVRYSSFDAFRDRVADMLRKGAR